MTNPMLHRTSAVLAALLSTACPSDEPGEATGDGSMTTDEPTTTDPTTVGDPAGSSGDDATGNASDATGAPSDGCDEQMILDLGLVGGTVSEGSVASTMDGAGWVSTVDATAGGIMNAPTNPWIYLRFGPEGLEQVDVDDLQALESTEWHIAAKRFGIRLNGGVSGPASVSAAALEGMAYDDVGELPAGVELIEESFYTDDCALIDDGTGQGAPSYVLTPWWAYTGCVATSGVPFVIQLDDGSLLKLVVDAYYESGQEGCNAGGMMGMGSAHYTWRWAFLE